MSYTIRGSVTDHFRPIVAANVAKAGRMLEGKLRELIGIQGPPRSSPGEPPHRDTGGLQASIETIGPVEQGDLIVAATGTAVPHGLFLELGTSRMAARPWLSVGLRQNEEELRRTIGTGTASELGEFFNQLEAISIAPTGAA